MHPKVKGSVRLRRDNEQTNSTISKHQRTAQSVSMMWEATHSWRGGEGGVMAMSAGGLWRRQWLTALCNVAVFNLTSHITKKGRNWWCKGEPKGFPVSTSLPKSPLYSPERRSIEYNGSTRADPSIVMFGKEHERGSVSQIGLRKSYASIQKWSRTKRYFLVILNNLSYHCTPYSTTTSPHRPKLSINDDDVNSTISILFPITIS